MRNRINSKGTTLIKIFKRFRSQIEFIIKSHFKRNKTDFFIKYTGLNGKNNFNLIGDTWFMKRIKSSSKTLIDLQADAALISKTWHGESEIARYTVSHYNKKFPGESSPDLMFDDEQDTFWAARRHSIKIEVRFNVSFPW